MDPIRLFVCIALALPAGLAVSVLVGRYGTDRPIFVRGSTRPAAHRTVVLVGLTVVLFVLASWRFTDASWGEMLAYCAFFAVLLALSVIDILEYRLPDAVVLPSLVASVVIVAGVSVIDDVPARVRFALVGAAASFAVLLVAHLISPRGMGFGDVKFAALLGLAIGWQAPSVSDSFVLVLWSLMIGFGLGTLAGVVLLVSRRRNQPFPFGPFLALGAVATVLASRSLVAG
jgi:leader peptidase (prepilin peptidase)/N-methyltransferase